MAAFPHINDNHYQAKILYHVSVIIVQKNIHFILANNIISKNTHQKLNTYIPMVAFGNTAVEIAKLHVSDKIQITGKLNSREYIKKLDDGTLETRMAYEGIVSSFVTL